MFKPLLIWPAVLALSARILVAEMINPPSSSQAVDIEALVDEAARILETHGAEAFGDFRKKNTFWRHGDVYLFVVDMQGTVLFNAAHPDREGRDLFNERDPDGNRFHKDFIDVVNRFGAGWVDYMFPKPGSSIPSVKWSYVCGTRVGGVAALVGAGVYVD